MRRGKREFSVVVERDEDGYYVASVPELPGCHTQSRSLDKLITLKAVSGKSAAEAVHAPQK